MLGKIHSEETGFLEGGGMETHQHHPLDPGGASGGDMVLPWRST